MEHRCPNCNARLIRNPVVKLKGDMVYVDITNEINYFCPSKDHTYEKDIKEFRSK